MTHLHATHTLNWQFSLWVSKFCLESVSTPQKLHMNSIFFFPCVFNKWSNSLQITKSLRLHLSTFSCHRIQSLPLRLLDRFTSLQRYTRLLHNKPKIIKNLVPVLKITWIFVWNINSLETNSLYLNSAHHWIFQEL